MRRELLQPDDDGRVSLEQLGLTGDAVIADEIEPGKWMLQAAQLVPQAGDQQADAGSEPEDETGEPDDELEPDTATREMEQRLRRREKLEQAEKRPTSKQEKTTVDYGTSGKRIQRPANAPPPGGGRR